MMFFFFILARGRSGLHLAVLEAFFIRNLDPELCAQKENVSSLQLFRVAPRHSAENAMCLCKVVVFFSLYIFFHAQCCSLISKRVQIATV